MHFHTVILVQILELSILKASNMMAFLILDQMDFQAPVQD